MFMFIVCMFYQQVLLKTDSSIFAYKTDRIRMVQFCVAVKNIISFSYIVLEYIMQKKDRNDNVNFTFNILIFPNKYALQTCSITAFYIAIYFLFVQCTLIAI